MEGERLIVIIRSFAVLLNKIVSTFNYSVLKEFLNDTAVNLSVDEF